MVFCCNNFDVNYHFRNSLSHSIRIIKYKSNYFLNKGGILVTKKGKELDVNPYGNDMRFLLMTAPYSIFDQLKNPAIMIHFCPFCGVNLYQFYDKDEYANEIEGETFTF